MQLTYHPRLLQLLSLGYSWQMASDLGVSLNLFQASPGLVLVVASLILPYGFSHMPPGAAQAAINSRSFCSFSQEAPRSHREQLTLACREASPKGPQNQHTWGVVPDHHRDQLIHCTSGTPKEWSQQAHEPTGVNPTL